MVTVTGFFHDWFPAQKRRMLAEIAPTGDLMAESQARRLNRRVDAAKAAIFRIASLLRPARRSARCRRARSTAAARAADRCYKPQLAIEGGFGDTSRARRHGPSAGNSRRASRFCGPNTMASTSAIDSKMLAASASGAKHGDLRCASRAASVPRETSSTRRSSACGGAGADSLLYCRDSALSPRK